MYSNEQSNREGLANDRTGATQVDNIWIVLMTTYIRLHEVHQMYLQLTHPKLRIILSLETG